MKIERERATNKKEGEGQAGVHVVRGAGVCMCSHVFLFSGDLFCHVRLCLKEGEKVIEN